LSEKFNVKIKFKYIRNNFLLIFEASYETYLKERGIEKKSSLMDRQVSLIESACCTIERSHNFKFRCIGRSMDKGWATKGNVRHVQHAFISMQSIFLAIILDPYNLGRTKYARV